ncbi:MAG: LptA/OstA family protein [Pseudanabaenaceae cyanobacterium]
MIQRGIQRGTLWGVGWGLLLGLAAWPVTAQRPRTALTIRADIQEADARSGVVTARGNVRLTYPARQIEATAAQAQYFSQERRIVLSGNVVVVQLGNRIQAETLIYRIDEGRFEALPPQGQQVESVYVIPDDTLAEPAAATTPVEQVKPAFKKNPTAS